jgi:hypothetical protein
MVRLPHAVGHLLGDITKLRGMRTPMSTYYSSSMTKNKGGPFVLGPLMPRCHSGDRSKCEFWGSFPVIDLPQTHAWHSAKMGPALLRLLYSSCTVLNGPSPLYQQLYSICTVPRMGHAPCINNCVTSSSSRPFPIQLAGLECRWEEGASSQHL